MGRERVMTQELPACDKQVREDHLLTSALGSFTQSCCRSQADKRGAFLGIPSPE